MKTQSQSQRLVIGGSAFNTTIGQVKSHLDLPKSVIIFRKDRKQRLDNLAKNIVTNNEFRQAKDEALSLIKSSHELENNNIVRVGVTEFDNTTGARRF